MVEAASHSQIGTLKGIRYTLVILRVTLALPELIQYEVCDVDFN